MSADQMSVEAWLTRWGLGGVVSLAAAAWGIRSITTGHAYLPGDDVPDVAVTGWAAISLGVVSLGASGFLCAIFLAGWKIGEGGWRKAVVTGSLSLVILGILGIFFSIGISGV